MTADVMMYSTAVCPYCVRAETFLRARGVAEIAKPLTTPSVATISGIIWDYPEISRVFSTSNLLTFS